MYEKLVIGIDQSYNRTGISIAADGKLLKVRSIKFEGCENNTEKREKLASVVDHILQTTIPKANSVCIITERIRTFSGGFISTNYIKSTGAIISIIVDTAYKYKIPVYSVDTRSWKAQVIGTSKGGKEPTIDFVTELGFNLYLGKDKKGIKKYDDDAADSACIALYGFIPEENQKLNLENS